MLLFANKMGVHWYLRFAVNTADNRDILSNYITFKEMFPSIFSGGGPIHARVPIHAHPQFS